MAKIKATKKDWQVDDVLNLIFDCDLGEVTIREYFIELARRVWQEGDGFSGKRPFGNSGWRWNIYLALAIGGFIRAKKDAHGDYCEFDEVEADKIIDACLKHLASMK